MTTLLWCLLALVIGVIIGYKYCAYINGKIMQALYDSGYAMFKTQDGWQAVDEAKQDYNYCEAMKAVEK
jgi:hypothetical protein